MGLGIPDSAAGDRGRIIIVGIFSEPVKVDLHRILWRELQLCGTRVYERQDFEKAIQLAAKNVLPLDAIVSATYPLTGLKAALEQLSGGGSAMKVLIDVQEGSG